MRLHLQLPQCAIQRQASFIPSFYMTAVAPLIWFVTAAWLLFGGSGYIDLALATISVPVFTVVAIPMAL